MNDRDADIAMVGFLLGAALFAVLLASCCTPRFPRGPSACISPTPTLDCAGGVCPCRLPRDETTADGGPA